MWKTLRVLYGFVFRKKLLFCGVILLVVLSAILSSITPYFYKLFVEAIPSLNYQYLINILFIYLGVNFAALILDTASFWLGDIILFNSFCHALLFCQN